MLFIPVLQIGLSEESFDGPSEIGFSENLVLTILNATGVGQSIPGIMLLMLGFFCLKGVFIFVFHSYSSYLKGELLTRLRNQAFSATSSVNLMTFFSEPIGFYVNIAMSNQHVLRRHSWGS